MQGTFRAMAMTLTMTAGRWGVGGCGTRNKAQGRPKVVLSEGEKYEREDEIDRNQGDPEFPTPPRTVSPSLRSHVQETSGCMTTA